jgi:hypothetical protein
VDKVDIVVSEWMGYFLLFEGMLDAVIYARNKWMSPTGLMCPSKVDILLAGIQEDDYMNERFHFWNNVYGFDMTPMKQFLKKDAQVDIFDPQSLITKAYTIKSIDTNTSSVEELDFCSRIDLLFEKSGTCHGLLGWFDVYFEGESLDTVFFSTGIIFILIFA